MRDGKSSRRGSGRNSPQPRHYGLAIGIGLTAVVWALIIGIVVLLL
jgi:hypothetical protein